MSEVLDDRDISALPTGAPIQAATGRKLIATIGIDRYRHWRPLHNAVRDARGVGALFHSLGFEDVVPPLLDEAATSAAINELVTDELNGLSPDDNLVVFFAGHGGTRTQDIATGSITTGYLIPVDSTEQRVARWIEIDSWLRRLARLSPRHILVILDACHSGIALAPIAHWHRGRGDGRVPFAKSNSLQSRMVITSALNDEVAMDSGPVPGHSLFTGCLIEALTLGGIEGTDQGGSRVTTGSDLGAYVRQRVQSYPGASGWQQTPDYGGFDYHARGEMLIPLRDDVREPAPPKAGMVAEGTGSIAASDDPKAPEEPIVPPPRPPPRPPTSPPAATVVASPELDPGVPANAADFGSPDTSAPDPAVVGVSPVAGESASAPAVVVSAPVASPSKPAAVVASSSPSASAPGPAVVGGSRAPIALGKRSRVALVSAVGIAVAAAIGLVAHASFDRSPTAAPPSVQALLPSAALEAASAAPTPIASPGPASASAQPVAGPAAHPVANVGGAGKPSPPNAADQAGSAAALAKRDRTTAGGPLMQPGVGGAPNAAAAPPRGGAGAATPSTADAAAVAPRALVAPPPAAPATAVGSAPPAAAGASADAVTTASRRTANDTGARSHRLGTAPDDQGVPAGACGAVVDSLPKGAEIVLDGKLAGVTPKLLELPCGVEVEVTLRKAGYVGGPRKIVGKPNPSQEAFRWFRLNKTRSP